MRAQLTITFGSLFAALFALAPAARADDTPTTILILDGSGSMWGQIEPDRRAKIDIVRGLLKPIVQGGGQTKIGTLPQIKVLSFIKPPTSSAYRA